MAHARHWSIHFFFTWATRAILTGLAVNSAMAQPLPGSNPPRSAESAIGLDWPPDNLSGAELAGVLRSPPTTPRPWIPPSLIPPPSAASSGNSPPVARRSVQDGSPAWGGPGSEFDSPSRLVDDARGLGSWLCLADDPDSAGEAAWETPSGRRRPNGLAQREGQRHDSYSRPYRSHMPELKQVRRHDPWYQDPDAGPLTDLFGEPHRPDRRTRPPVGSRGQWFGRYEALLAWPYYSNGHTGLVSDRSGPSIAEPFEHNLIYGNRGLIGWESTQGPGGSLQYTDLFSVSQRLAVAATGGTTEVSGQLLAPGILSPVAIRSLPGERLEGTAREHLTSYRPTVFKRVHFPISTITGGFGFDHTILRQSVSYARFADLGSTVPSETLDGRRRFSGIGPSFDIEYHRPIGHTQLAILGGAQLGVVFGSDRWDVLRDGNEIFSQRARRAVTSAAVKIGVEWSQAVGSKPQSRVFARFTIEGQNWLHVGSFSHSDASLGFLSGNLALGAQF